MKEVNPKETSRALQFEIWKNAPNPMLTFVKNDSGRPEAADGAHDDLVMAHAIALHIRSQQTMVPVIKETRTIHYEEPEMNFWD